MAVEEKRRALLDLVSTVKARLEGRNANVTFPIPQFIVIGKQSVGKSRLIEALAGECFNFVSGTLGSRRPTTLEFRNDPRVNPSEWSVADEHGVWRKYPVQQVMQLVGKAHNDLGTNVTEVPIRVKVEGANCVDLGLVDLPGFRQFARDAQMQELSAKIERMVEKFMNDDNNVMIVVEEAGDAAGFSTLTRARNVDPTYRRTILIRNKLDKYYRDLTADNINKWLEGYGDLSEKLPKFALSLPHWTTSANPDSGEFDRLRRKAAEADVDTLVGQLGASQLYRKTIGFQNFRDAIEVKTQQLFSDALGPLVNRLNSMREESTHKLEVIAKESSIINENNILHATRSAGVCFAQSFNFLMEGSLTSEANRKTIEEELRSFHQFSVDSGFADFFVPGETPKGNTSYLLPPRFSTLEQYVDYLRNSVKVPGCDMQLNGGAQFKRLMYEVEVFTRAAGIAVDVNEQMIAQAMGVDTSFKQVITKVLVRTAPGKMQEKTKYVAARLKWFFMQQKEATLDFMSRIKGSAEEHMYSALIPKQAEVIARNDAMKNCIFAAFDKACENHRIRFQEMWFDYMDAMCQSPLTLLKAGSTPAMGGCFDDVAAPTLEDTKKRIEEEVNRRNDTMSGIQRDINGLESNRNPSMAIPKVREKIEQTFSAIRCQVADQMQLYSESFFLLPMLRRLEGDMSEMELAEDDRRRYRLRNQNLEEERTMTNGLLQDVEWSVNAIQKFQMTVGQR